MARTGFPGWNKRRRQARVTVPGRLARTLAQAKQSGGANAAGSAYKIETMAIADFTQVMQLWRQAEGVGLDQSDSRPALRRYMARNRGLSFVARHGRQIAGAVLCGHDGRRGFLYHLAVAREHRRHGVGRKLVEACLDRLKRIGIHKCNILLFRDNLAGARFWKKNGWVKRTGLLLMQKPIVPSELKRSC